MQDKKIVNIGTATGLNDVVDFKFVRNTFVNKRFPLVSSNLDMQSNRITSLATPVSQKDAANKEYGDTHYLKLDGTTHMTGDLDLRGNKIISPGEINMNRKLIKDLDTDENDDLSAVNKEYGDTHYLKLEGTTHMTGDLDLRGNKIISPGEINMNRKLIKDLDTDENDDLSAVNMITLKNKIQPKADKTYVDSKLGTTHTSNQNIDLKENYNIINSKQQSFSHLTANYDNLLSYSDVKNIFLSRKETFVMQTALDMGNHQIFNVKDPTVADHGVNKKYVDDEIDKKSG